MADAFAKTVAALAVLGSVVGGVYAARHMSHATAVAADLQVENGRQAKELADCTKVRDEDKKARAESEMLAADAAASLTASRTLVQVKS